MITYHNGNLLESGCDIIAHQVNLGGIMGGGLALQIAKKYPKVEKDYQMYCKDWGYDAKNLAGDVCFIEIGNTNRYIANCFSQDKNFNTRYDWLESCVYWIKSFTEKGTVGVAYGYGCGIADGDWNKVLEVFEKEFSDSEIELQIWKLGE